MSWGGFKKAVNRASTQVMLKSGHVEQTVDREFENEERRFRTLEQSSEKLQKSARGYLDALRAMTSAQVRIAETIDLFYGDSGIRDNVSKHYLTAVKELDVDTVKELDEPYRETVLDPITRFCSYFGDINEAIKKRNHRLLDYDRLRHKTLKLVDKPSKDPAKLPAAERDEKVAQDRYDELNDQLSAEIPQLIDFRVPYLDPSFEALVKIQMKYCTDSYNRLAEVQQFMDPQIRENYATGQIDSHIENTLMQMRELQIVSL